MESAQTVRGSRLWFWAWLALALLLAVLTPVPALLQNAAAGPWQHKMVVRDALSLLNVSGGLVALAIPGVLAGVALGSLLAMPFTRRLKARERPATARRVRIALRTVAAGCVASCWLWFAVFVIQG